MTEAPIAPAESADVTEAPTDAPATEEQTQGETEASGSGCGSALDVSAVLFIMLCGLAVTVKGLCGLYISHKKEN